MNFTVDRELPVPLGTQLRGLIEYGIACGELAAGSRLPSVRRLAEQLCLAPMTVSQVYRELQGAGLIETRPGHGTFVAAAMPEATPPQAGLVGIRRRIDRLIADAAGLGLDRAALAMLFNARLGQRGTPGRGLRVVLVGTFAAASEAYATAIQERLPAGDRIVATTFERFSGDEVMRRRLSRCDLALTFAHRKAELARLLGPGRRVAALSFVASESTRQSLAALAPETRLGVVSALPEFLPMMMRGIRRHAPQVAGLRSAVLGNADLPELLAAADAVVFATGAERVAERLAPRIPAFEYRHIPDPRAIDAVLLPLLEEIRAGVRAGIKADSIKMGGIKETP